MEPIGERIPLRLAPWASLGGKPCYLVTKEDGFLSQIADAMEAEHLEAGTELLEFATELLADKTAASDEVRAVARYLCEALRSALRIAESRGARLPVPACEDDDDGIGPDVNGGGSGAGAEDAV